MIDLDKLKQLAEAATPGPWRNVGEDGLDVMVGAGFCGYSKTILWRCNGYFAEGTKQANNDANYVSAANPAAILELIAEVERLRSRIDAAPVAIMDTRDVLGICAPNEDDFPALYSMQGKRVRLVLDDAAMGSKDK